MGLCTLFVVFWIFQLHRISSFWGPSQSQSHELLPSSPRTSAQLEVNWEHLRVGSGFTSNPRH